MSTTPRVSIESMDASQPPMTQLVAKLLPAVAPARRALAATGDRSVLAPELREMIRLQNATTVDCGYCRNVRYSEGGAQLVPEDTVRMLTANDTSALTPPERAALAVGAAFHDVPLQRDAEWWSGIRAQLSGTEIVDAVVVAARCRSASKALIALGLEPEDMPVTVVGSG